MSFAGFLKISKEVAKSVENGINQQHLGVIDKSRPDQQLKTFTKSFWMGHYLLHWMM